MIISQKSIAGVGRERYNIDEGISEKEVLMKKRKNKSTNLDKKNMIGSINLVNNLGMIKKTKKTDTGFFSGLDLGLKKK